MTQAHARPSVFFLLPFLHYGAGQLVLYLAEALSRRGVDSRLITCGRHGEFCDDPVVTNEISKVAGGCHHVDIFSRDAALMERAARDVGELWREHRPAFAHAFTAPAAAAVLPHGPVLASVVGWGEKKEMWQKQMDVVILDRCAGVTAVSEAVVAELLQAGLRRSDLALIRNGVALDPLQRRTPDSGIVRIGVMAHLIPRKGVDVFLKALPLLVSSCRLQILIAGTGEAEEDLKRLAALGTGAPEILWLGQRPVADFLAEIDILVVPSRSDALPLVLLQAMAGQLPIVASAVGGIPEALEHGVEGILVPPDNPERLASAINQVIANPDIARAYGLRARQRADREFSVKKMLRGYFEAYFKMVPDPAFQPGAIE